MMRWMLPWLLACREPTPGDGDKPEGDPDVVDTDEGVETDISEESDAPVEESDPPVEESDPPVEESDVPVDTDAPAPDADVDSVVDAVDQCPGQDDRVDLDGDAVPDCVETMVPNAQVIGSTDPYHLMPTSTNIATMAYAASDASGWAGSGSLHMVNVSATTSANAAGVFSGCAAAGDIDRFDILYHYRVPSNTAAGTNLQLITSFDAYSDANCLVPWGSITPGPPALTFDQWSVLTIRALEIPPPVHGVMVRVELFKPGTSASVPFELDDVLLQPAM